MHPHAVHAPPTLEERLNKSYAERPIAPDGVDEQGPFWLLHEVVRVNSVQRCPDCGQDVISAHDSEIAQVGFGFIVCWDLGFPRPVSLMVNPCHEGCLIACGQSPT